MAVVYGTLSDIGFGHLAGLQPEIVFSLSGPATNGRLLYVEHDVVTQPDLAGDFTVNLEATTNLSPASHYDISVRWLRPGRPGGTGFSAMPWPLTVPVEGGPVGALLETPAAPGQVWVASGGDVPALSRPGDLLYDPDSGDLFRLAR